MKAPLFVPTRCEACGESDNVSYENLVESVRRLGHLKRTKDPSPELIFALLTEGPLPDTCSYCNRRTVWVDDPSSPRQHKSSHKQADVEFEGWPDERIAIRKCQGCGEPIDPDRLEIFPDTTHCMSCQQNREKGSQDHGFCSFCGGHLVVQQRGGSGLAGYQLKCTNCGKTE